MANEKITAKKEYRGKCARVRYVEELAGQETLLTEKESEDRQKARLA